MTTIAWDGTSLAVDKQCTTGSLKNRICKVHKISKHSWAAITGTVVDCLRIVEVLKGEREELNAADDFDGWVVVFNTKTGKCFEVDKNLTPIYLDGPAAFGSGAMAAQAWLVMGLDAASSVRLASKVDCYTSEEVDIVTKKGLNK